jgi:indoleamine 2,3-dioxygenase
MEYAGSYALFNYRLEDPKEGFAYSNLRLIRAFENGLDPSSSEAGFVLVHVDMVKESGPLVAGTLACFNSLASAQLSRPPSRDSFNAGLQKMLVAMQKVNKVMETMWTKSKPARYTQFRTFIFGIISQSMFPRGVVYEGVWDEPRSFRGESGANDSMVPLLDNFLQIYMPETPLTEILRDFRKYRPTNHREFLLWVKDASVDLHVKEFALSNVREHVAGGASCDNELMMESSRLWLKLLDQVREFRWRHWCFAREYILKMTKHPTATGGSPIVTWLPNQLEAVLDEMETVYRQVTYGGTVDLGQDCSDIMDVVSRQKVMLAKEVAKYCAERGIAA